jgi:hypothetical protein
MEVRVNGQERLDIHWVRPSTHSGPSVARSPTRWRRSAEPDREWRLRWPEDLPGHAAIPTDEDARQILAEVMAGNDRAAKFYGIQLDDDGTIDPVDVQRLAEAFVPIVITTIRPV